MDPALVGGWAAAILAVAGVVRLGITLFAKAVRAALDETLESLRGDLDDLEDWWVERLGTIEDHLTAIDRELRPNGGASLRDSVDRLERCLNERE